MKKVILILILLSFSRTILGQTNLVPNWSFENHIACPSQTLNFPVSSWFSPTGTSTDLFDSCSTSMNVPNSQGPYSPIYSMSGHGYIGMHQYSEGNREYAQVQLTNTLTTGTCYYGEFYTRVMGISPQAINNMGMNISVTPHTSYPSGPPIVLPTQILRYGNPIIKDTLSWTKVSGIYVATGGEQYVAIGNFNTGVNTDTLSWHPTSPFAPSSYYFVDAVSLYSINPTGNLPWVYNDTTVVLGDSVYIGNYVGGNFNPAWYTYTGNFITNNAGIYVKPTITSKYIVQFTVCGVPRTDTIKVTVTNPVRIEENTSWQNVSLYPNPTDGVIYIDILDSRNTTVKIFNLLGQQLKQVNVQTSKQDLSLTEFSDGIYFLQLCIDNRVVTTRKIMKRQT